MYFKNPSKVAKFSLTGLLSCTAMIALPVFSHAQDNADPDAASETRVLDTVTVSGARGRDEDVQDVPLSQTVFSAKTIEEARIDQVDDFLALTPGVTIANAQDSGTNFITIRGISQVRNGEAPVAVIVDDVLQINSRSFDQPLFDLENVEVLRGPQGALYGRNATGGAIIINTKAPTETVEGYIQGTVGEGDEFQLEGSVSGPIAGDKILGRVSGRYLDRGGYLDNVFLDEKVDFIEDLTLRGHLSFILNENWTADLRASVSRTEAGSLNFSYQPAVVDKDTGLPTAFDFSILDADLVEQEFTANNLGKETRDVDQLSLRINGDLGFADLRLVSAYDSITQSSGADQFPYTAASTVTPAPPFAFFDGTQYQFVDVEAFSQEIRLTSKDDQAFRWMVGAYVVQTDRFISSSTMDDLEMGITPVERNPIYDPNNPLNNFIADSNDNFASAAFFNVAYDVTDKLELAFAGRYDQDEREQTVDARQGTYAAGVLTGPIGTPGAVNKADFDLFQPKITARYLPSEHLNFYASWGKGFRSGQFNQNGVGVVAAGATPPVLGVSDLLPQEETTTFELGAKSDWNDGRTILNGSIYQTDIENAPYFVFIGAVGAQVLVPIDEIQVFGGEIEFGHEFMEGLDGYVALGITDSEIDAYTVNTAAVGNKAPYVADTTFNAGLQYRTPITTGLNLFGRVDYEMRGEQFWDPENSTSRSALDLVNLRLGVESSDGTWALTGSVENATDEVYNSEWVSGGFAHAGLPRVIRVDLRYNF